MPFLPPCAAGLAAALLAALVAAPSARAADCAAAATQSAATQCYGEAFRAADGKLNAAYREITRRLADDADAKALLVSAQRAWIAFRDAECRFSTSAAEGGSIQPMLVSICMAELTSARTGELAGYLDCAEGDMACPVPPAQ